MVLVPIIGFFLRHKIGYGTLFGVVLSVAGLYFLCITDKFTINKGDLLVLSSTIFWAAHVHLIGWLSIRYNFIKVAVFQNLVCAALSAIGAILTEEIVIANIHSAMIPILYAGILSTGIAYTLQVAAQRIAPPTHAAVMLSTETLFAALFGYLLLHEIMTSRDILGCVLMLAGILMSQLCIRKTAKQNNNQ
jgi:drug/metabolite transporter (DMT)-like permease